MTTEPHKWLTEEGSSGFNITTCTACGIDDDVAAAQEPCPGKHSWSSTARIVQIDPRTLR